MAYADTYYTVSSSLRVVARPFVAFGNFMVRLSEASSMAQAANKILELSDEDLAAQGLTRNEAVQRVFAKYAYL